MKSKQTLVGLFILIICSMLLVTTWASLYESVFVGAQKIAAEPWGIATFADTYFAFLTFYVWVFYKEVSPWAKLIWLLLILTLGNISMAAYVLWQLYKLPEGTPAHQILLRSTSAVKNPNV